MYFSHDRLMGEGVNGGSGGGMCDWVGDGMLTVGGGMKGVQFCERNPFKRNFWKAQNFAQKSEGGVNFPKEIPLNGNF